MVESACFLTGEVVGVVVVVDGDEVVVGGMVAGGVGCAGDPEACFFFSVSSSFLPPSIPSPAFSSFPS